MQGVMLKLLRGLMLPSGRPQALPWTCFNGFQPRQRRRVVDNFTITEMKDILQYSEPEAAALKGLKEELKARLLKLTAVVQTLKAHEVASAAALAEVASTPAPAEDQPMPRETAEPPSIESSDDLASIYGAGSSVDSAQVGEEVSCGVMR